MTASEDYSHYPKALRPPSKKVKEAQRAARQKIKSARLQKEARLKSKSDDYWENIKKTGKSVGKEAAAEILMSMVPVARIPKLLKIIAKLGPQAGRAAVANALKKGGFDKLASTAPSASELKRVGRNAEARAKVAEGTRKAEHNVARDKRYLRTSKVDVAKEQTLQRSTPKKQVAARRVQEERADHLASEYGTAPPRTKAAQKEEAEKLAAILFKRDGRVSVRKDGPWGRVSKFHQKELIDSLKTAKKAKATERKVNKLADLSDTIAKNAAKRKAGKPKGSQAPLPPAPGGSAKIKRAEGFVDSTAGFDAATRVDLAEIPKMASRLRKLRGRTMTTSPKAGDMQVRLLDNDIMLVRDPRTRMETRFRGKVRHGGKTLEWSPEGGTSRFNRDAIREINDKFGINLIPPADLKPILRKAAEAKAKK